MVVEASCYRGASQGQGQEDCSELTMVKDEYKSKEFFECPQLQTGEIFHLPAEQELEANNQEDAGVPWDKNVLETSSQSPDMEPMEDF